jgi:hypothetical protein
MLATAVRATERRHELKRGFETGGKVRRTVRMPSGPYTDSSRNVKRAVTDGVMSRNSTDVSARPYLDAS